MRLTIFLRLRAARAALLAAAVAASVVACSGSAVTLVGGQAPAQSFTSFATASNVMCVQPTSSPQTVSLPSTGGVSGTISFGAHGAAATGCDYVKISTGADVETSAGLARFVRQVKTDATAATVKPLLTTSVGEGLDGTTAFGYEQIVTGLQLNTGPNVNFPDGTYYATITSPQGNISSITGTIAFTAKNGVLTIAPLTLPNGNSFPLLITANTASIITLYPRGVMPPESTPKPAPSPTVAPSESPGPSASPPPFETSQPNAGAYGNPPPENGSVIGNYDESGSVSYCAQYAPCSDTNVPMEQQNGAGIIAAPNGFSGLITFSANIGYMGIYPPITNTCPSDWSVVAGISGCSPGPERRVRPRAVQHHV